MVAMPHTYTHHSTATATAPETATAHAAVVAGAHSHSAPTSPVEADFRHPAFPFATFPLRRRGGRSPPAPVTMGMFAAVAAATPAVEADAPPAAAPPAFVDPFTSAPAHMPSVLAPVHVPAGGVSMVRSVSQPVLTSSEAAAYAASRRWRQRSRPSVFGAFGGTAAGVGALPGAAAPDAHAHAASRRSSGRTGGTSGQGSTRASASASSAAATELADPHEDAEEFPIYNDDEDEVAGATADVRMESPLAPLSPTPRMPCSSGPMRTSSVLEPRFAARPYPATPSPPPLARHACAIRRLTPSPSDAAEAYSPHAPLASCAGVRSAAQSTISRAAAWRTAPATTLLTRPMRD